ncbi:MAG: YihY/virulence factor BrkB family protein [Chroococcidiopsidaceae cyanobacterium CP_BM_ER_R8_30]|nr:YihY/virulence factor BrkB family protein [Chroococcidiopsidaceae cyanobacterium CP_BM_ER_R8_30]
MLSIRFFRFFRYLFRWSTLKKVLVRIAQRRLPGLSGEIAYNAMFSLFPAILALLAAISLFKNFLGDTFNGLATQISQVAPDQALAVIHAVIQEVIQTQSSSLFSISFVVAIWVASAALSSAMFAFDQIAQIPPEQVRPFWKAKLISIGLTIGTIVLLLVASFLVFISDWLLQLVVHKVSKLAILLVMWRLLSWPLALGIVSAAFAFVYRYGPSRWTHGTPVMPGAVVAAVLWAVVSAMFRLYVADIANFNRTYGAIGAVMVLMLWLYLSALVLLVGNELNVTVGEDMRAAAKNNLEPTQSLSSKTNSN